MNGGLPGGLRTVALALVLGAGVAVYLELWFRWPTFISIAFGALVALLLLIVAASVGHDPDDADEAWREAAPDLQPGVRPDLQPGVRPDLQPGVRPDLRPDRDREHGA